VLAALLNGVPIVDATHGVDAEDRGLQYGDGLFETMLLSAGAIRAFDDHLARLRAGCERLHIAMPDSDLVAQEIGALTRSCRNGIVKLTLTRGAGGRGYRADPALHSTRLLALYEFNPEHGPTPIVARWCTTRLARNPLLAGIKHLNRLEQVLAQNEWRDDAIAEGLMLDIEGELIGGTSSNVFAVTEGALCTPDLRFSGIRGVMREQVLRAARALGVAVEERALWPHDIDNASEVFVTNAVRGIRPVTALGEQRWPVGAMAHRLADSLRLW
jgi:4-amino-4-deoxychorismate lyase